MKNSNYNVRIPTVTSLQTAIRLFYERTELSNEDIRELFGDLSSATIARLKNVARKEMAERNTPVWSANRVNTEVAYVSWGLSIDDLERRYEKLKKLSV